ncbi:MAG: DUF2752 domain-containing protein, partial [Muribaculum sp.]|nr:DUF2752 domain-containing protein [Muribaculum sp.]
MGDRISGLRIDRHCILYPDFRCRNLRFYCISALIPSTYKKKFAVATVTITVIVVTVIYAVFDPTLPWFPKCLFRQLTGLECPGCGSQRAIHALL